MIKISDLRQKEVINIIDGKRLGFISDLDIDLENGIVKALIIPGQSRILKPLHSIRRTCYSMGESQ